MDDRKNRDHAISGPKPGPVGSTGSHCDTVECGGGVPELRNASLQLKLYTFWTREHESKMPDKDPADTDATNDR
jgi:hypothetical protein